MDITGVTVEDQLSKEAERVGDLFDKYEVILYADMYDEIFQILRAVYHAGIEKAAQCMEKNCLPRRAKKIRALKTGGQEDPKPHENCKNDLLRLLIFISESLRPDMGLEEVTALQGAIASAISNARIGR